jgi:hypothetical protein
MGPQAPSPAPATSASAPAPGHPWKQRTWLWRRRPGPSTERWHSDREVKLGFDGGFLEWGMVCFMDNPMNKMDDLGVAPI